MLDMFEGGLASLAVHSACRVLGALWIGTRKFKGKETTLSGFQYMEASL
jgi:hypothetical protein